VLADGVGGWGARVGRDGAGVGSAPGPRYAGHACGRRGRRAGGRGGRGHAPPHLHCGSPRGRPTSWAARAGWWWLLKCGAGQVRGWDRRKAAVVHGRDDSVLLYQLPTAVAAASASAAEDDVDEISTVCGDARVHPVSALTRMEGRSWHTAGPERVGPPAGGGGRWGESATVGDGARHRRCACAARPRPHQRVHDRGRLSRRPRARYAATACGDWGRGRGLG
jgi:hypothetical protein